METITLSGGGALQTSQCDTWRVTEECDVTIRNMTPTIITACLVLTLLTPNQALFFGIRNARQRNDMYLKLVKVDHLFMTLSRSSTMMVTTQSRSTSGWGWSEWTPWSGSCPQVKQGRSFELILITLKGLPERLSNTGEVLQRTLWGRKGS